MNLLQYPLVKITIGFVLGLLAAHYFHFQMLLVQICFATSFLVFGILYFLKNRLPFHDLQFIICTGLVSVAFGSLTYLNHNQTLNKKHYSHFSKIYDQSNNFEIELSEKLKTTATNTRFVAHIKRINQKDQTGKIILNIPVENTINGITIGSCLKIKGILQKNKTTTNPHQFDYGLYLAQKQIYAQLYCNPEVTKIGIEKNKNLWFYADQFRTRILTNLTKNGFNKTELNVALALILGQQQDISPEIIQDYQYAGAVHILSVSGLHIGFVLLFISFLLKPIPNTKRGSWIKLLLILFSLFSFGFVAGFSPSVIRSVTMFSFVAVGNHLRRSTNIFHTLVVSLLIILAFEPAFLFDVGFQLSYIALFFILWLQPLLSTLWAPKNKLQSYFWDILTVSFAAQIGTLPLSIYYFHQFPGLFFITNCIVLPSLSVIMLLGVVTMLLASVNIVPNFLSETLEISIRFLNKTINFIASFEQFILKDIPFNSLFLIGSYFLILSSIVWVKKPNFARLIVFLLSIICFQLLFLKTKNDITTQQELIVFNLMKKTMIAERKGAAITLYSDTLKTNSVFEKRIVTDYVVGNFSKIETENELQNVYFFDQHKIILIDSTGICPSNIQPEIIILSQSPRVNLERLILQSKPKQIIADGSNYKSFQLKWRATCAKYKIPFHSTYEKGFYKFTKSKENRSL